MDFKPLTISDKMKKLLGSLLLVFILMSCKFTTENNRNDLIVCIAFDDNCASVYHYALPQMHEFGYRGTVFTNSGTVGRTGYMSWQQVDSLYHTFQWEIGGHTANHEHLPDLTPQEADEVIRTDFYAFQNRGISVKSFALPCGACPAEYYPIILKHYMNVRTSYNLSMRNPVDRTLLKALS